VLRVRDVEPGPVVELVIVTILELHMRVSRENSCTEQTISEVQLCHMHALLILLNQWNAEPQAGSLDRARSRDR
jgi:hypothetical protein